jgi:hypothetical protein
VKLDFPQTRRLYLAGTVAFPVPFPAVGTISIVDGYVKRSARGRDEPRSLVIVRELSGPDHATTRVIQTKHVAAIFIFKGQGNRVDNFENGEWILSPVNSKKKRAEGKPDAKPSDATFRGIVFVPEYRPVLTINEITQTAGAVGATITKFAYDCECESYGCECETSGKERPVL